MALLALASITKSYYLENRRLTVLRDISFAVEDRQFLAIMGPSGSGKSTLLNILGCLDVPTSGTYRIADDAVSSLSVGKLVNIRRKNIGFIFQSFNLLPRLTALQNVELPLLYAGGRQSKQKAHDMLKEVGLADRAHHRPNELSGGEQQRVAIARALVNDPKVILADEPTGNLDSATGKDILRLFQELHSRGKTIIMVTHDQLLAGQAERIIEIHDGRITHA